MKLIRIEGPTEAKFSPKTKNYESLFLDSTFGCHKNSTPGKITKIQCKTHTHNLGFYFRQLKHEDQAWGHTYPLFQEELFQMCVKRL